MMQFYVILQYEAIFMLTDLLETRQHFNGLDVNNGSAVNMAQLIILKVPAICHAGSAEGLPERRCGAAMELIILWIFFT